MGFSSLASSVNVRVSLGSGSYTLILHTFFDGGGDSCALRASNTVSMMTTFKSSSPAAIFLLSPARAIIHFGADTAVHGKSFSV